MNCPHCASTVTKEQTKKTSLGYRRYRCPACKRAFNERTGTRFNSLEYLCSLLRISVRKISSLKARIWYYDGRCHGLWRGRSCEANADALGHTFLKPEIELAMWSQEEGERWCERN